MWRVMTGSLSIIRQDLKPLHPAHVEALIMYCAREGLSTEQLVHVPEGLAGPNCRDITPLIDPNYQASAKQLLAKASKESFSEFFARYMDTFGRVKYGDVPFPYGV
jgi:hypothetical protein